jgi:tyrosyl-tRNA synthetase
MDKDIPVFEVKEPVFLFRLLVDSGLVETTGEARRLILDMAIRLEGEYMIDPNEKITINQGISKVLQVGRRKFVKLENKGKENG